MAAEVEVQITATDNFSTTLGNFGNIVTGIKSAIDLVGMAFNAASDAIQPFITSASESETAIAKMEAVLRATGGAAGLTSQQLQDMATALQGVTEYSDETILQGATLMLTFRNIGTETMLRAIPAMLDMAEIFGSVDSAAMQLGKALNDPVNMMGALSRAGVTFSDAQKEAIKKMVEMGDLAGAQNIILTELEMQVGGTAKAIGDTFAGTLAIANNKLDDFKEKIGGPIIYLLKDLLDKIMEFADTNPAIQSVIKFFDEFNGLLQTPDVPFLSALGAALLHVDVGPLQDLGGVLLALQGNISSGMDPFTAISKGLEALAQKWKDTPMEGIVTTLQTFMDTAKDQGWGAALKQLFDTLWDNLTTSAKPKIQTFLDNLSNQIAGTNWEPVGRTLANLLIGAITLTLKGLDVIVNQIDWKPLGTAMAGAGKELWEGFKMGITNPGATNPLSEAFLTLANTTKWSDIGLDVAKMFVAPFTNWLLILVSNAAQFVQVGREIINGIVQGIKDYTLLLEVQILTAAVKMVLAIKSFLGIASPSRLFFDIGVNIVQGLIDGWKSLIGDFIDLMNPFIDLGISSTGTVGGMPGDTTHSTTGGTTSTTGTGGGVIQYFYGPVYVGSMDQLIYDCAQTNPLLQAGASTIAVSP